MYESQLKMMELMSQMHPNVQFPLIVRPEPFDPRAPLPPLDDDQAPVDDTDGSDAANLED